MRKKSLVSFLCVTLTLFACLTVNFRAQDDMPKTTSGEKKRISLYFKDADLRDVLQMVSDECGVNIALGKDIQGTVTVNLNNVTVSEALKSILSINHYDYAIENDIIVITPGSMSPNTTKIFTLEHVDATTMQEIMQTKLSPTGQILPFIRGRGIGAEKTKKRSNVLIITATPGKIEELSALIKKLDVPLPQVSIKVRILEANLDALKKIGVDWNVQLRNQLSAKDDSFKAGILSHDDFKAIGKLIDTKKPHIKTLADPLITTLDNQEAEIVIGEVIPVPTYIFNDQRGAWKITGYEDKNVGITLRITPHITPGQNILMTIKPEVSEIIGWVVGPSGKNEKPIISIRKANTQVRVKNNDSLVISGLTKDMNIQQESKVPLLGDIPILGYFFRYKRMRKQKTDLLIFISPVILTEKEGRKLTRLEEKRWKLEQDLMTSKKHQQ
ncbi:MAG: secretin and TonB N-terminal domain-containing protein [Planctomycetes bacterium]|nr:secretin and TonB N-terminal domain-containing protein [Planctomycetota bacterium]